MNHCTGTIPHFTAGKSIQTCTSTANLAQQLVVYLYLQARTLIHDMSMAIYGQVDTPNLEKIRYDKTMIH